jgi:hypothetical protein
MGSLIGRSLSAAGLLVLAACDLPCEFRIVMRTSSMASSVGCCGATAVEDIVVGEHRDLAVDLAQAAIPNQQGGQDVYLTGPDCQRLFDGPYPAPGTGQRPSPQCAVILGPVARGRVSPRAEVAPGRYRVFVQAYDSNTSANDYRFDVSVWGASCGASPAAP